MVNTLLTIALEELFKKEPFDLENDTFIVQTKMGIVSVKEFVVSDYEYDSYDDYNYQGDLDDKDDEIRGLEDTIEELRDRLNENDIEHDDI